MQITPYVVPGFWTVEGALAKVRQLVRRGFPDNLRNWRFVTLTLDRERYPDPEEGYEKGLRQLRELIYRLRKKYRIKRWCWKLEFHEADEEGNIWPHWHLLLEYKRPIPLDEVLELWGKGRVEVKGVTDARFDYLFKYVTKAVSELPDWVLDRAQMRLFQTSMHFFPSASGGEEKEEKPSPRPSGGDLTGDTQNERIGKSATLRERIHKWSHLVTGRTTLPDGSFRHRLFRIKQDNWGQLLVDLCHLRFANGVADADLKIRRFKIESNLSWISNSLPALRPAFTS